MNDTNTTTQAEEIGLRVLLGVQGKVKSIDGGYDCVYIETEDGKVYSVNVTECEEVDWPVHHQPLISIL